jgi:hypothetical protein
MRRHVSALTSRRVRPGSKLFAHPENMVFPLIGETRKRHDPISHSVGHRKTFSAFDTSGIGGLAMNRQWIVPGSPNTVTVT